MGVGAVTKAAAGIPVGFGKGLTYVFAGARFVYFRHPGLIRYWIIPILISIFAIAGAAWASWTYSEAIIDTVWPEPDGDGFFSSMLRGIHNVLEVIVSAIVWFTSLFLVLALSNVIAAPFNDALSEAVERLETGAQGSPFSLSAVLKDTGRTVWLELTKLIVFVGVMGPLLCCGFTIPVIGQLAYPTIGFLFTSLYLSMDYIDWPACRHKKSSGYRWAFLKTRFSAAFGFGTGVFLLLMIPGLNLLFMPAAVAGGTLLFLDVEGIRGDTTNPPKALES